MKKSCTLRPILNNLVTRLSSVSAVECLWLDVGPSHWPPLVHVLRDMVPAFNETIHVVPPSRSCLPQFLVCPQSVQKVMRAVQRLSVPLATWPALMTHLRIIRMGFQMIFYITFRYAGQSSRSVVLEAGKYYYVVGLQKGTESTDSLSAGVRLPSGRFMRPITKEILQWRLPGKFGLGLLKYLPCLR